MIYLELLNTASEALEDARREATVRKGYEAEAARLQTLVDEVNAMIDTQEAIDRRDREESRAR